jgi:hypothetical protein
MDEGVRTVTNVATREIVDRRRKKHYVRETDWREEADRTPTEILKARMQDEWRWTDKRVPFSDYAGSGMPVELKQALRNAKAGTGIPMAEFIRWALAKALKRKTKKDKLLEARELIEQVMTLWHDKRLVKIQQLLGELIIDQSR